jgi:hypothetical protein
MTFLGLAVFLLVILWVGQWTRERVAGLERYTVAFADIDCPPPPNQSLPDFLAEVQYLGSLPDRLHILDENLPAQLADAFARHPEVEKVQSVTFVPPGKVRVQLIFRNVSQPRTNRKANQE